MTTSAADSAPLYPHVPLSFRLPGIIAGLVVVAAIVISAVVGHIFFGLWFGLGAVLIFGNALLVRGSVAAVTAEENPRKKPLVFNSAVRLGIITVFSLVIAYFFRPQGLGVMFGLAVCQIIVVLATVLPVMKGIRNQS